MAKKKIKFEGKKKEIRKEQPKEKIQKTVKKEKLEGLGLTAGNYIVIVIGLILIILGYFFLKQGSITLAPILLVLGYVVLIPLGLIVDFSRFSRKKKEEEIENK